MNRSVQDQGAQLVVVSIPSKEQVEPEELERLMRRFPRMSFDVTSPDRQSCQPHQNRHRLLEKHSAIVFGQSNQTLGEPMRFDIIDILRGSITHYENAFTLDRRLANC